MTTAEQFDMQYITKEDVEAAGGNWLEEFGVYTFPDGSAGRFTDIRDGAQESALHWIAIPDVEPLDV